MTIPFLPVDFVILAVLGLSGFFAAYRGFVNELLSIFGWGLAAIITAVLFGSIKPTVRAMVQPDMFADVVGFVGLFLAVIIPISFVAFRVGEAARQSSIGPLDRSLGFVYGVVRGLVIAAVAFIIFDMLSPKKPEWITEAKLIPIVQRSGDVLMSLVSNKSPKGVQTAADPRTPPKSTSKPQWSPLPGQQVVSAEPTQPPPPRQEPTPRKTPAAAQPESPPPPASEVGGLAPFLNAQPAPEPPPRAKPKPQPKPAYRSVPMENADASAAKRAPKTAAKPSKQAEKAKPKAKQARPDAKQAARKPPEKRAPKNQVASSERRPTPKAKGDKDKGKGYGQRDRQALDQLVRSTTREP
jgi:membrane protein required for colicin V production